MVLFVVKVFQTSTTPELQLQRLDTFTGDPEEFGLIIDAPSRSAVASVLNQAYPYWGIEANRAGWRIYGPPFTGTVTEVQNTLTTSFPYSGSINVVPSASLLKSEEKFERPAPTAPSENVKRAQERREASTSKVVGVINVPKGEGFVSPGLKPELNTTVQEFLEQPDLVIKKPPRITGKLPKRLEEPFKAKEAFTSENSQTFLERELSAAGVATEGKLGKALLVIGGSFLAAYALSRSS